MIRTTRRAAVCASILLLASGCLGRHMLFATHTQVGVAISGVGEAVTDFTFGYDRYEGVLMQLEHPRMPDLPNLGDDLPPLPTQLPALFACVTMQNGWLDGVGIAQTFATGASASAAAGNADVLCPEEVIPGKELREEEDDQ